MANMIHQKLTRANGLPILPFIQPYLTKRGERELIDFSKIVPDPAWKTKGLKMSNGETIQVFDETQKEGEARMAWYYKNWGTHSWGFVVRTNEKLVEFRTKSWPAVHVIQKLADMYDVSFGLEWADIDDLSADYDSDTPFEQHVGKEVFKPRERIIPFTYQEHSAQIAGAE
jgi:hypothetical protein